MSETAPWAAALGVALVPDPAAAADPGIARALLDGIDRGSDGPAPPLPGEAERYAIVEGDERVGLLAVRRDCPRPGSAAVIAIAVAPPARGRARGTRALLAAERRLAAEGAGEVLVRVPRTNGRGLYFVLRAGFTPVPGPDGDDATWFARRAST